MERFVKTINYLVTLSLCLWPLLSFASSDRVTLKQVEQLAIKKAPELEQLRAKMYSLKQMAIAAGQWQDPKLMLGAMNVPTDTFDIDQEPMTQLQVGLMQTLPKGRSLYYQSQEKQDLATAKQVETVVLKDSILRSVRLSWLNLYYSVQVKKIILEQEKVLEHLLTVTESMLANNKSQQKDVIGAQFQLASLQNQLININEQIDIHRSELARWVGMKTANLASPNKLPSWPMPSLLPMLQKRIQSHPELQVDKSYIDSSHASIQLAKQQYWPTVSVGVVYGYRSTKDLQGNKVPAFLSATATIDLPLFTQNRQHKVLQASEEKLVTAKAQQTMHFRQLTESLRIQYATWQQSKKQWVQYQQQLIPQAKHYAKATLIAYQNGKSDFSLVAGANVQLLKTQLASLTMARLMTQARIKLLYLQGQ